MMILFFFFFQAEDGIRDIGVTGVQTCALPISDEQRPGGSRRLPAAPERTHQGPRRARQQRDRSGPACGDPSLGTGRSEERRVGKECRSRWSRYHKKKKTQKKRTGVGTT